MLNLIAALVVSASLMPPGKQMYLDNAGNPLAGGKVYTYAAGTSTPLATYSDQAGTTPNANPVVLNSRGEASIFWGAGPYKVTLRTSADALIWTQDNIYPPLTAGSAMALYSGGSAASPELTWTDDLNSGFYLIGADNIGLSLGGTKRWDYAASGSTLTGTLTVTGAATLQSTLGVTGAATFSGSIAGGSWAQFLGSVSAASGSNRLDIFPSADGGVEFVSSAAYVDFKSNPAADFDVRIYKATGAHLQINGTPLEVLTPVDANDAATKAYADALVAVVTTTLGAGANWTLGTGTVVKRSGVATVFVTATAASGSAGWGAIGTVPVGFRPAYGDVTGYGQCVDASTGPTAYPCRIGVSTAGDVFTNWYDNGTSDVTPLFTIAAGDSVSVTLTYVVAE